MWKEDAFNRILADDKIPSAVEQKIMDTLKTLPEPSNTSETDNESFSAAISTKRILHPGRAVAAACLAFGLTFSGICITHPVMASGIPMVGNVFADIGKSLGFGGDFSSYTDPAADAASPDQVIAASSLSQKSDAIDPSVDTLSETADGTNITIQDTYCGGNTLYISLIIHSQKDLPVSQTLMQDGKPDLNLNTSLAKFSFDSPSNGGSTIGDIDGKFLDSHTYEGVIRLTNTYTDFPKHFNVTLNINDIIGMKKDGAFPDVPEDLQQAYRKKLSDAGLSEDLYQTYSTEQQRQMDQWYADMMNEYSRRYPETDDIASPYLYWKITGPWNFRLDITRNNSDVLHKTISVKNLPSVDTITLTKTPFELSLTPKATADSLAATPDGSIEYKGESYFYVLTDATGDWMMPPLFATESTTFAVKDWDTSSVTIYAMPYIRYMDQIKGAHIREDGTYIHKDWRPYLESYALWTETVNF